MYFGIPGPLLATPGCQPQLPAAGVPSAAPALPALPAHSGTKKGNQPLSDGKRSGFNTFYSALGNISAKISINGVTFGTLFVAPFGEQRLD